MRRSALPASTSGERSGSFRPTIFCCSFCSCSPYGARYTSRRHYTGLNHGVLFSLDNVLIALMLDWAVTNSTGVAGKFLNSPPMVFTGMMSYSIYLWQQPFLHPNPETRYFAFPFNLIGFTACVLISYFVVEKLSLRLRKRYESARPVRAATALVPESVEA
jgi:peptidoglycan/LPS O-acetylase OafA/YrhL